MCSEGHLHWGSCAARANCTGDYVQQGPFALGIMCRVGHLQCRSCAVGALVVRVMCSQGGLIVGIAVLPELWFSLTFLVAAGNRQHAIIGADGCDHQNLITHFLGYCSQEAPADAVKVVKVLQHDSQRAISTNELLEYLQGTGQCGTNCSG